MDDANLFAGIDLIELIPLITIGVVESASKQSSIPVASTPGVLGGTLRRKSGDVLEGRVLLVTTTIAMMKI